MADKIDITMTAVIRPAIFEETLVHIKDRVCRGREGFRLILNVDPVGENIKPMKVVKTAKRYFDDVVYRIGDEPSFPKAVKWVWSQSSAPYVFHWEDDVNILRKIDVDVMISILKKYEKLSSLRLYKAKIPNSKSFHTFNCRWTYKKDGFYIADDWKKQFGLNPILIKREFIEEAVTRMVDNVNPEKQFRFSQKYMRPLIQKWKYGIFGKPGDARLIDGRKGKNWKNKLGLQKPKGRTFLKWENTK